MDLTALKVTKGSGPSDKELFTNNILTTLRSKCSKNCDTLKVTLNDLQIIMSDFLVIEKKIFGDIFRVENTFSPKMFFFFFFYSGSIQRALHC